MHRPSFLADFPRPLLFAHRGLNRKFLENTMESFEAAARAGIPGIELDVHLTRDGALVVFHDDTTGRIEAFAQDGSALAASSRPENGAHTANEARSAPGTQNRSIAHAANGAHTANGAPATSSPRNLSLETSTLAELRSLPIGPRLPLLSEVFEQLGGRVYIDIELKSRSASDTGLAASVAKEIRAHGLERRCVISSFNPFALRHFRRAEPGVPIGIIWSRSEELYWFLRHGEGALIAGVDFLKPEASLAAALPWYLRLGGGPVVPWTVNEGAAARGLIDHGAAGIITDVADEVMPALSLPLTPPRGLSERGAAAGPRRRRVSTP